mmetsp:Transcript_18628/g.27307  ORF Transcript_18628/g.27307 Transcript_18628/m.27307 type:complete len:779 (-) Transcript_18628:240-2576(-)
MRAKGIVRFITLLLSFDVLLAFSVSTSQQLKPPFFRTVTSWLDEETIAWRLLKDKVFPRGIDTSNPILEVTSTSTLYYLHILKSPASMNDCLSPTCTRDMTNYVQYLNTCSDTTEQSSADSATTRPTKMSIIHLHEDVWYSKTDIVQSRLRTRLGGGGNNNRFSRIYARKTKAKRIDAGTAIPFLQKHHLWSATKARYYYGLFLPSKGTDGKEDGADDLVAVATFSTKRKIVRGARITRSHELIRFCSRADGVVIGGITKLIRTFIKEQEPVDDIITVVDRDWGPGDGWHSIGFETLHVSAPLFMVVKDGIRRHLVGAGIKNKDVTSSGSGKINDITTSRPGIEEHVLEELASLNTCQEALHCLEHFEYYPVYDAGVERLVMAVTNTQRVASSSSSTEKKSSTFPELKAEFVPSTYAATYRTNNSGISAILGHVMAQTAASLYGRYLSEVLTGRAKVNDPMTAQSDADAWKATGGANSETLVYKALSSLDPFASVEVKERSGGWCTLGIVGGTTKSIRHGNFKVREEVDRRRSIDSSVMAFEYLRSMAAMALVGLEYRRAHPNDDDSTEANLSCLYLGFGAGSLPRFMASLIPKSQHVAIELDEGVVSAAHQCRLLKHSLSSDTDPIELQVGDALTYKRPANSDPFDIVFVDIFDDGNILPPEFYSAEFLDSVVYRNHLGGHSSGIVIHNFHTGGKALGSQLADAIKNYRSVFSTTLTVESVDSRHTGGNTILLATNKRRLDASSETLSWRLAGVMAQQLSAVNFDVIARTTHKLWLS